jgi:UDP-4-amino-4,6-dideoxy-N-acetyl-beta-L-altrosamine transaminase
VNAPFFDLTLIQAINPFLPNVGIIEPREEGPTPTARPPIPYGRQSVNEKDVAAVCRVLRSDFLTQGPAGPAFEMAVAEYCGARQAVAVNSGTAALHLACLALGVGAGDRVWTSPITFVASANCAVYCGAEVDFVDIDPQTYNLNVERLKEKLEQARVGGRLPKVVIPVHLAGQACDLAAIYDLAQEYGFRILEDACHALGGRYRGEPVGNGRYSDITVFSFHPVKTITTGEGGMALTNDQDLANRLVRLRTHGLTRDPLEMTHPPDGPWYYQQLELGFNYRLTDIQAALGLSQLERLDAFVAQRHVLARRYDELLAGLPVVTPWQHPDTSSGWHLYVIRLPGSRHRRQSPLYPGLPAALLRKAGFSGGLLPRGRTVLCRSHQPADFSGPDRVPAGSGGGGVGRSARLIHRKVFLPQTDADKDGQKEKREEGRGEREAKDRRGEKIEESKKCPVLAGSKRKNARPPAVVLRRCVYSRPIWPSIAATKSEIREKR